jgi:hypothetical protein
MCADVGSLRLASGKRKRKGRRDGWGGGGGGERYAACRVHISAVAGSNQTQTPTDERERVGTPGAAELGLGCVWSGLVWCGLVGLGWLDWIGSAETHGQESTMSVRLPVRVQDAHRYIVGHGP